MNAQANCMGRARSRKDARGREGRAPPHDRTKSGALTQPALQFICGHLRHLWTMLFSCPSPALLLLFLVSLVPLVVKCLFRGFGRCLSGARVWQAEDSPAAGNAGGQMRGRAPPTRPDEVRRLDTTRPTVHLRPSASSVDNALLLLFLVPLVVRCPFRESEGAGARVWQAEDSPACGNAGGHTRGHPRHLWTMLSCRAAPCGFPGGDAPPSRFAAGFLPRS